MLIYYFIYKKIKKRKAEDKVEEAAVGITFPNPNSLI